MTDLAGGVLPWADAWFGGGAFFDQIRGVTSVDRQWVENTDWGNWNPATCITPGRGVNNAPPGATADGTRDPVLADDVAAALVGGSGAGPIITGRIEAVGPNVKGDGWYIGRFDLPNYNQLVAVTVNNKVEATTGSQVGNGIFAANPSTSGEPGGYLVTGLPPGGNIAFTLYPDGSSKISCGGGAVVTSAPLPGALTPPTHLALAIITQQAMTNVEDYDVPRVTFWRGDISGRLMELSA